MRKYLCIIPGLFLLHAANGQHVGLGTNTPDPSAKFEIADSVRGLLLPRVQLVAANSFAPINGTAGIASHSLLVYNSATAGTGSNVVSPGFYYWDNTVNSWKRLDDAGFAAPATNVWNLTGNTGTSPATHFVGTADNRPFYIKTNNMYGGRIESGGGIFWGLNAGAQTAAGLINTAYGANALAGNTVGFYNTAFGNKAMANNTTGFRKTAIGFQALEQTATDSLNTAAGYQAMQYAASGIYEVSANTATGASVLKMDSVPLYNTAVGASAMSAVTRSFGNTAIGAGTLNGGPQPGVAEKLNENTSIGGLPNLVSGRENTAAGVRSGYNLTAASANTLLGYDADLTQNEYGSTVIGANAKATQTNMIRLGSFEIKRITGAVDFTSISDSLYKYDVQENVPGREFIMQLKPATYFFDDVAYGKSCGEANPENLRQQTSNNPPALRSGFIAQEVEAICKTINYQFDGLHIPNKKNPYDQYAIAYAQFIPAMVKTVQQQQQSIEKLQQDVQRMLANTEAVKGGAATLLLNK